MELETIPEAFPLAGFGFCFCFVTVCVVFSRIGRNWGRPARKALFRLGTIRLSVVAFLVTTRQATRKIEPGDI